MSKNVAVLMGGWSSEREVSLVSGAAATKALKEAGYSVTSIDVQRDMGALMTRLFPRPDAVFNALHGRFGEDGCVQGLLDILNIPYTHSSLLASALAMDKPMAKRLFAEAGIRVAKHVIVTQNEIENGDVIERPYVIKPLNEGSSIGVHVVREGDDAPHFRDTGWPFGQRIMVESFVPGREFSVAVMERQALGVTEITTDRNFNDYEAKYAKGGSEHTVPADIPQDMADEFMRLAVLAHQTLGCRGISRADFRFDGEHPVILEVNTQPGITPASLVPQQALYAGISFPELVSWMVEHAECDP